jgi:hypothetical protein
MSQGVQERVNAQARLKEEIRRKNPKFLDTYKGFGFGPASSATFRDEQLLKLIKERDRLNAVKAAPPRGAGPGNARQIRDQDRAKDQASGAGGGAAGAVADPIVKAQQTAAQQIVAGLGRIEAKLDGAATSSAGSRDTRKHLVR